MRPSLGNLCLPAQTHMKGQGWEHYAEISTTQGDIEGIYFEVGEVLKKGHCLKWPTPVENCCVKAGPVFINIMLCSSEKQP